MRDGRAIEKEPAAGCEGHRPSRGILKQLVAEAAFESDKNGRSHRQLDGFTGRQVQADTPAK